MRKFREMNLYGVAAVAAVVFVVAAYLALNFSHLPLISHQRTYRADFASAIGLQKGDVVTIAGVRVGAISGMSLRDTPRGTVAEVSFTVNGGPPIGQGTTVDAKVLNPVGVEYIQLTPKGPGRQRGPIPTSRTTIPGTLVEDLNQLTTQTQQTNIPQLVKALSVVSDTLAANSPAQTKAAIDGVSKLSAVLAGRQDELTQLVNQADQLTQVLNSRTSQLVDLLGQADLVLQVLNQRKAAIDNLLKTTSQLTGQIDHLIVGDRSVLDPMLANLQAVSAFLARDSHNLSAAIPLLAAFSRYSANVTGSGPFADFVAPTLVVPDNLVAQCAKIANLDPQRGCRV
jgi:phospholipid/cholesterol/gamma-HCH transport system substrate-binding protein